MDILKYPGYCKLPTYEAFSVYNPISSQPWDLLVIVESQPLGSALSKISNPLSSHSSRTPELLRILCLGHNNYK
ncbi:hypothetical protein J6590_102980, partial [Homalodisca vitripennis]